MPNVTSGVFTPNEIRDRLLQETWPESGSVGACHLVKPASVSFVGSGSTASIGSNGTVTFSGCDQLFINGLFSATYSNYLFFCNLGFANSSNQVNMMLSKSGVPRTDTYKLQNGITQGVNRSATNPSSVTTLAYARVAYATFSRPGAFSGFITFPLNDSVKLVRSNGVAGDASGYLFKNTYQQTFADSYDGVRLSVEDLKVPNSGFLMFGSISFYGLVK